MTLQFRKPSVPGDMLIVETELLRAKGKHGRLVAGAMVNGDLTSKGL